MFLYLKIGNKTSMNIESTETNTQIIELTNVSISTLGNYGSGIEDLVPVKGYPEFV